MNLLYRLISIIGILIGYSTNVAAQYGIVFYPERVPKKITVTLEGKIKTNYCKTEPGNIKLEFFTHLNNKEFIIETDTSSTDGKFHIMSEKILQYCDVYLRLTPINNELLEDTTYYLFNYYVDIKQLNSLEVPYINTPPCIELPIIKEDFSDDNLNKTDSLAVLQIDSFSNAKFDSLKLFQAEDFSAENNINLFPNPNKGQFAIEFSEAIEQKYQILIYDMNAKLVLSKSIQSTIGNNTIKINTHILKPGTYTLILSGKNKIAYKRYVQQ